MANIKQAFDASTNFVVTLASLASSATQARTTVAIDNTANLYLDAICHVAVKSGAGAPTGDQAVFIYAYASVDGTNYADTALGTDALVTLSSLTSLRLVCAIAIPAATTTYNSEPFSIAQAFNGILPPKWGLAIRNSSGNALDSTEGNHFYKFRGVYATTV